MISALRVPIPDPRPEQIDAIGKFPDLLRWQTAGHDVFVSGRRRTELRRKRSEIRLTEEAVEHGNACEGTAADSLVHILEGLTGPVQVLGKG